MIWLLLATDDHSDDVVVVESTSDVQRAWAAWKRHVGDCVTRFHATLLLEYEEMVSRVPTGPHSHKMYKMTCVPIPAR